MLPSLINKIFDTVLSFFVILITILVLKKTIRYSGKFQLILQQYYKSFLSKYKQHIFFIECHGNKVGAKDFLGKKTEIDLV